MYHFRAKAGADDVSFALSITEQLRDSWFDGNSDLVFMAIRYVVRIELLSINLPIPDNHVILVLTVGEFDSSSGNPL